MRIDSLKALCKNQQLLVVLGPQNFLKIYQYLIPDDTTVIEHLFDGWTEEIKSQFMEVLTQITKGEVSHKDQITSVSNTMELLNKFKAMHEKNQRLAMEKLSLPELLAHQNT